MGTSEIVELDTELNMEKNTKNHHALQPRQKFSIEDDINKLFEAIDIKNSGRVFSSSQKKAMKRPISVSSSQASGIGISESVSLKQALRGLCISQASEMAAMKRLSKPLRLSRVSESGNIKRLNEDGEFVHPSNESGNLVQISLIPENATSSLSVKLPESQDGFEFKVQDPSKSSKIMGDLNPKKLPMVDEILPSSYDMSIRNDDKWRNANSHFASSSSKSRAAKSAFSGSRLGKPSFKKKNFAKEKVHQDSSSITSPPNRCNEGTDNDLGPSTSGNFQDSRKFAVTNGDYKSSSREKGEFSQSSKSSIGEYSSSTSFSDESNYLSGSTRPHMSKDLRWEAIRCIQKQQGSLGLRHFKLLKKIGGGDIGTVYLAELSGTKCSFALKIMDNEFLAARKKIVRAQTEREIMQMLDHPFLPTLYVHFVTDKFSCLVMEYCPGGDLHVLGQKQPNKNFSELAARFYVAEVLLALEYLHMLGVVYRDLKPENILVREDGHIMLSDFDLSLRCSVNPTLLKSSSSPDSSPKRVSPRTGPSCIDPFCLQPTWFKSPLPVQVSQLPELVVEPTSARSNSFVGTHEYLAPEIIKGEGHGSSVDWWMFGIFLYELLYGRTPFKGTSNEDTLSNVVSMCLEFPQSPMVSCHARDLIRRLLKKEPENRLGSVKGAVEIKQHPFFEGMNWALIRCEVPREMPRIGGFGSVSSDGSLQCGRELKSSGENPVFEMF